MLRTDCFTGGITVVPTDPAIQGTTGVWGAKFMALVFFTENFNFHTDVHCDE